MDVFDACYEDNFHLHAMLFCVINDFSTYDNFSGYNMKVHYACPICEENTNYAQLSMGQETVYNWHRKFLSHSYIYRRIEKTFNRW